MARHSTSSFVVTMPPSPPVVMILSWQKLHAPTWPMLPTLRPLYWAPCAWAQSSITFSPCVSASAMMASISQGQPAKWTQMIALVFGVSTLAMVTALRLPLSASTSANTGVAPALTTQEMLAIKVRGVTTTSSPGPIPSAFNATSSASVPLPRATAWCVPAQAANSFSNLRHSVPVQ